MFWIFDLIKNIEMHFINAEKHLSTDYNENSVLSTEMEQFLLTIPDILEVCVVGISIGSGITIPAAVIVRKSGSHLRQVDVFNAVAGTKLFWQTNNIWSWSSLASNANATQQYRARILEDSANFTLYLVGEIL